MPQNQVNLLLFSKPVNAADAKTRLRRSSKLPAEYIKKLHTALVLDTINLTSHVGFSNRYIAWAGENPSCYLDDAELPAPFARQFLQEGADFGARLSHAVEAVSTKDAGVVLIGSDCPYLTPSILNDAKEKVSAGSLIIGPSQEGGFYLLGLPKGAEGSALEHCFSHPLEVLKVTEAYAEFPLSLLPFLNDIDLAADLATYIAWSRLVAQLPEEQQEVFINSRELLQELEVDSAANTNRETILRMRQ